MYFVIIYCFIPGVSLILAVMFQDYFDIVKNPMDLSTIKRKLDTGLSLAAAQNYKHVWMTEYLGKNLNLCTSKNTKY